MYSASTDKQAPPPDAGKFIKLGIIAIIGVIIFATVGNQAVSLSMNFTEFGEQFTKPLFYTLVQLFLLHNLDQCQELQKVMKINLVNFQFQKYFLQ